MSDEERCPECGSHMTDTDRGRECMANVYNMGGCGAFAELARLRPLVAEVARLRSDLAECYRITGADPDGDDDAMLARKAVNAVRRLREESDTEAETAEAEIVRLRAIEAEAKTYLANMDYCFTAENLTVEDEGHRDASESRLRALLAKGGAA